MTEFTEDDKDYIKESVRKIGQNLKDNIERRTLV